MAEQQVSLRTSVLSFIGDFLFKEGFARCSISPIGILSMINLIADYYEEGAHLFPEVIITNNLDFFDTIPSKRVIIAEVELKVPAFKKILKLCAPLAQDGWVIFVEIKDKKLKYGLIRTELTELSPSLYRQTVGNLEAEVEGRTVAYLKNIGGKRVELKGQEHNLIISLTLDEYSSTSDDEIFDLSTYISSSCDPKSQESIVTFIEKTIAQAIKVGHGNLIGVIVDSEESINKTKKELNDGAYLLEPIDLAALVIDDKQFQSNETSTLLNATAKLFTTMLNHDGITILTDKGKIIGYHVFINTDSTTDEPIIGGARTRAFIKMKSSGLFETCFYKSQDGNSKIWKKDE